MTGPILTFDSGLGGLSVFRHVQAAFPGADHLYVADDLGFPYGDFDEHALHDHCVTTLEKLIKCYRPVVVIIACNTASTLVLDSLRARFDLPFVGTVPAVKPAAECTKTGLVSVLATPGTVARDYTKSLISSFAVSCDVTLVGAPGLAALAQKYAMTGMVDDEAVAKEIAPCFVAAEGERKTDVVVLACTHYPLLLPIFERLQPWAVTYIDPAPAIARRVGAVLGPHALFEQGERSFVLTSGKKFPDIFHKNWLKCA